jgi:hypothetical protein
MFKVGDRVVAVRNFPSENDDIKAGSTGVVCDIYDGGSPPIGVCWDEAVCGHDCNHMCEYGRGWYVYADEISLDYTDCGTFVCADEQALDDLLG